MGLSMLVSVYSEYGIEHDIKYNSTKSNVMIFSCKKLKDIHIPNFLLNGETLPSTNILGILSQIYATMMTYLGNTREFMLRVMP